MSLPSFDLIVAMKLFFVPLLIALLLLAERRWPWRVAVSGRAIGNWGLALLNAGLLALLPVVSLLTASAWSAAQGIGLFHFLTWPAWLEAVLAFCLLDLAIYAQHRFSHWQPLLWRLHRVHHTDPMLDASSGLRFHPIEALLSACYKALAVLAVGASGPAVTAFATALTAGSLFAHANIRIPAHWQRRLRWVIVTPAMHRVHHSIHRHESDRNYGFFLPWWDYAFGSYLTQAQAGDAITIGQAMARDQEAQRLRALLVQPMRAYPPHR
jgi:sterol desaturase/sphingolipid hydroxylase (fatty acid hydroxylase superfamily)